MRRIKEDRLAQCTAAAHGRSSFEAAAAIAVKAGEKAMNIVDKARVSGESSRSEGQDLAYFRIGDSLGGNQDWFPDWWMNKGGCAAATACDCCIYFYLFAGKKKLYPFSGPLTREAYIDFSRIMKPYLSPRMTGINRLNIYREGLSGYFRDAGDNSLTMTEFAGGRSADEAVRAVKKQIGNGFPVPFLTLKHRDPAFSEYVWHWYLLTGWKETDGCFLVRAVTYGAGEWLDLKRLWDTGYSQKGGMILFESTARKGSILTNPAAAPAEM